MLNAFLTRPGKENPMRSRLLLAFVTITLFVCPALAQKRNITEKDLFNFVWAADPQIAPDGSRVAFVRVTVNEKKDGYNTAIWSVSPATGESHQLTAGPRDSSPRWSPDGKYLCFVRVPEKDGRPDVPQLYMLAMAGGDSFPFTTIARGAGGPQWSPDGKMIAFVNGATAEELAKQKETLPVPPPAPMPQPAASPAAAPAASPAARATDQHESDVRVINRAVYRANGAGYLDTKHPQHIWVIRDPRTGEDKVAPVQLTKGRYDDGNVTWSRNSLGIYFASDHTDEPYYDLPKTDIYSVAVSGGSSTKLTSIDMGTGAFSVSPDGKQIAFYASVN